MKASPEFQGHRRWSIITLVTLLLALTATAVYAATTTIDTDDGSVDPNWAHVGVLRDDDVDAPPGFDLDTVWIANNSALDTFYFRADTPLLPLDSSASVVAKLDCDGNDGYTDAADVVVVLDRFPDGALHSSECQGSVDPAVCAVTPMDINETPFAEEITLGGSYAYEWQAPTAGHVDWSACMETVNVQFMLTDSTSHTIEHDTTEPRAYNAPSAVAISAFAARAPRPAQLVLLSAGLASVALLILRRRS